MIYGLMDSGNHKFYTYLHEVLPDIAEHVAALNWLVTDSYCSIANPIDDAIERQGYFGITGEALLEFARQDRTQWIGAVFSGFEKDIPFSEILRHPFPVWEHPGFWRNPLTMQHPLAAAELVPWDSCQTLLLSNNESLISDYLRANPTCRDLAEYNNTL